MESGWEGGGRRRGRRQAQTGLLSLSATQPREKKNRTSKSHRACSPRLSLARTRGDICKQGRERVQEVRARASAGGVGDWEENERGGESK